MTRRSIWFVLAAFAAAFPFTFSPRLEMAQSAAPKASLPNEPELTAKWWEWVYSIPVSENPLFDDTGADAANGQPYKGSKVFFLAGVINVSGSAERSITVREGTTFLLPIVNYEADNVGVAKENQLTVPGLYALAAAAMDEVTPDDIFVTLDDGTGPVSLLKYVQRVVSPPFAYKLPATDNIYQFFGTDASGEQAPAVADGFWLYIPALPKGNYVLNFGGTIPALSFTLDITYNITVD